jgi:hypothetical protein
MKKVLAVLGVGVAGWFIAPVLLVVLGATGCDNTTTTAPVAKPVQEVPGRFTVEDQEIPTTGVPNLTVYTDTKTGCEFLYLHEGEGNAATYIPHTCKADSTLETH